MSGYKIQQDLSEEQGSAKTVTSLLTLPSVLVGRGVKRFMLQYLSSNQDLSPYTKTETESTDVFVMLE